jgi:hypothetical protein
MKKRVERQMADPDMLSEYDFRGGIRGKYTRRYAQEGSNIVVLSPDVAAAFPTSEAVNEALCLLMKLAAQTVGKTARE